MGAFKNRRYRLTAGKKQPGFGQSVVPGNCPL
jgi:hypothetical protein